MIRALLLYTFVGCIILASAQVAPTYNQKDHWSGLPLLSKTFSEKFGYEAPNPFGASLGLFVMSQEFTMDKVSIDGKPVENFAFTKARGNDITLMPRLDVWVLPFLNVYGMGGAIQGLMDVEVTVDIPVLGPLQVPLEFEYKGSMFGGGATMAGGYKFLFVMLDANYSKAKLNTFDSELDMLMASGRLGVVTEGEDWMTMFWVGGMYQNMDQYLEQEFILVEGDPKSLMGINVSVKDEWNMLIGGRIQVGKRIGILVEGGFFGRQQVFTNLEYRF